MNDIIGPVSFDVNEENEFAVKPYSKKTARIIDEVSGKVLDCIQAIFFSQRILKIGQKMNSVRHFHEDYCIVTVMV